MKQLLSILLALVLCFSLAACSGGGEEPVETEDLSQYTGLWEYGDQEYWLQILDDHTWVSKDSQGTEQNGGTFTVEGSTLTFQDNNGDEVLVLSWTGDTLYDEEWDTYLAAVTDIPPQEAATYFEENGLDFNAEADGGPYLLTNGRATFAGFGEGYEINDCEWEVVIKKDRVFNGSREVEFDAICYVPKASIPAYTEKYVTNTNSDLVDSYTGLVLFTGNTTGDSAEEENHYAYTVEWDGSVYDIEFYYAVNWVFDAGEYASILTKSYTVYMPEDYDGLAFMAIPQAEDYDEYQKMGVMELIYPDAFLLDVDLIDAYNSLFFRI